MLLDAEGFELVSGVEQLLDEAAAADLGEQLKPELMQCVLESGTVVCRHRGRGRYRPTSAAALGRRAGPAHGMRLGAAAHPPVLAVRTPEDHGP